MFNRGESCVLSVLNLLIPMSLCLNLTQAKSVDMDYSNVSCNHNHICIDARNCPRSKSFAHLNVSEWPEEHKKNLIICNHEEVDGSKVLSVCCPTVLNSDECGYSSAGRISDGFVANFFQFPWMALIRNKTDNTLVCGGTLISNRYVLTAAHCVQNMENNLTVRLGEHDIRTETDCDIDDYGDIIECTPKPQDFGFEKPIIHKNYSRRYKSADIALIRLKSNAALNDNVKPICLHSGTIKQRILDNPDTFIVSGWGRTENGTPSDVLRFAPVKLVSLDNCTKQVQSRESSLKLNHSQICAGGNNGVNLCSGDSGSPLMYVSNLSGRCVLSGIVQYGATEKCGNHTQPEVFTNVTHFLSWIVENVDSTSSETTTTTISSSTVATTTTTIEAATEATTSASPATTTISTTTTMPISTSTAATTATATITTTTTGVATETTTTTSASPATTTISTTTTMPTTIILQSTTTTTTAASISSTTTTAAADSSPTTTPISTTTTTTTPISSSTAATTATTTSSPFPSNTVRLILYALLSIVVAIFAIAVFTYITLSLVACGLMRAQKPKPEVRDSIPDVELRLLRVKNLNENIPLDDLEKGLDSRS